MNGNGTGLAEDMEVDPALELEDPNINQEKIINEEYKVWKKNAVFLYDTFYQRPLDWPTLTLQWFPDVKTDPNEPNTRIYRQLLGTHTDVENTTARNYLQIAHFSITKSPSPNPNEYDPETQEIGGHGADRAKGSSSTGGGSAASNNAAMKWEIIQKIDHEGEVNKARYMPQNPDIIATMCINGKVCVFDRTKHPLQPSGTVNPQIELTGHTKEGYGLHWNPRKEGTLVTGSEDNTVKLWDIQGFSKESKILKPLRTFTHHSSVVNDVEFHPVLDYLIATVSDDLSLQILDTRDSTNTTAKKANSEAHSDAINSVAFNKGNEYLLATGSADKSIGIWDLRMLDVKLHACEGHKGIVTQVEWHPNMMGVLASASYDRRIIFWDLARVGMEQTPEDAEDGPPELMFMHGGHTNRISDFSFNLNDPWLMTSAAEDNLIHIWEPHEALVLKDDERDIPLNELEA